MPRILVIGGTGMLGHKLVQQLSDRFDIYTTIRGDFSTVERFGIFDEAKTISQTRLEDECSVRHAIGRSKPDVVINAAGIIKQLPASSDVIATLTINSILPRRLYQLSAEHGYRLILISTDCVFSGQKGNYTESDEPDAKDLYGRSKLLGEVIADRCLTIRTSFIGRELETSHGLVEWFLSNRGKKVKGFARAIYSGFPTVVFADIMANLLVEHPDLDGLYHISSDPIDKCRLLSLVSREYKANIGLDPDESLVIDRSLDSTRFRTATGFAPPPWEEMVGQMAADPTPYDEWRK